jgi:hypothetical protein
MALLHPISDRSTSTPIGVLEQRFLGPRCHRPPPGPAFGRPDDRLRRTIQYFETVVID